MTANKRWVKCRWCNSDWKHLQAVPQMDEDPEMLSVLCTNCGAAGPAGKGRKEAVRKWNKGPQHRVRMAKDLTCPHCGGDDLVYKVSSLEIVGSKLSLPIQCLSAKCKGKRFTFMIFKRSGKVCLRGRY